jgi:hypothetical protein
LAESLQSGFSSGELNDGMIRLSQQAAAFIGAALHMKPRRFGSRNHAHLESRVWAENKQFTLIQGGDGLVRERICCAIALRLTSCIMLFSVIRPF